MEGISNILCGRIFLEADEMSPHGEPVYYYHDLGLTPRFREFGDEVGRYGGPCSIGYF